MNLSEIEAYRALYRASVLWHRKTDESRTEALTLLRKQLKQKQIGSLIKHEIVNQISQMLVLLEQYTNSIKLVKVHSESSSKLMNWQSRKIEAYAYFQLRQYDLALKLYESLLKEMDTQNDLNASWLLNREEVRGTLGVSRLLTSLNSARIEQTQSKRAGIQELGKLNIETALHRAKEGDDYPLTGDLLGNMALYYSAVKKDNVKAEIALKESLRYHELSGVSNGMLYTLNNLGVLYRLEGRMQESQQIFRRAISLLSKGKTSSINALITANLANGYYILGDFKASQRYYKIAIKIYSQMNMKSGKHEALLGYGISLRELGEVEVAINTFREILNGNSSGDHSNITTMLEWNAYIELSDTYIEMSDFSKAEEYINRLEATTKKKLTTSDEFKLSLIQARIARHKGQSRNFLGILKKAERLTKSDEELPLYQLELNKLFAQYYLEFNDVDLFKRFIERALNLIESIRQKLDTTRLGPIWTKRTKEVLNVYIRGLYSNSRYKDRHINHVQIFNLLERYYAPNFRLRSRANRNKASSTIQNKSDERRIDKLLYAEKAVVEATTDVDLRKANVELERARDSYFTSFQHEENILVDKYGPELSIPEVQSKLESNEALIRYFISDELSFSFSITRNDWLITPLPSRAKLQNLLNDFSREIRTKNIKKNGASKELIRWVPDHILESQNIDSVIIIPDDILHGLSFSALKLAGDSGQDILFVKEYQVLRILSASDYFSDFEGPSVSKTSDITIFADPVFSKEQYFSTSYAETGSSDFRSWQKNLPRLGETAKEAAAIKDTYGNLNIETYLRARATNKNFMSRDTRYSKILHIASHGYFNMKTPDIVGLATSVIDEKGIASPGFLTLTEILSEPFVSDLIVISGCETMLGKNLGSEGLDSLSRGFLSQGAGSVVASLWPIPDRPTALFMNNFYRNLKLTDGDISAALHATKRQFANRGRYRQPIYWSGFVLTSVNRSFSKISFN